MTEPFYTADDHHDVLLKRGAPGEGWPHQVDSTFSKALRCIPEAFARIDLSMRSLLNEADPRTAVALLPEWERLLGLPDDCTLGLAETLVERQTAAHEKYVRQGGQRLDYFQGLAERLGYTVSIDEFTPFVCGVNRCGERLGGPDTIRFHWRVRVTGPRVTEFRAGGSTGGDRLGAIRQAEDLECLLNKLKPAHATLHFRYEVGP